MKPTSVREAVVPKRAGRLRHQKGSFLSSVACGGNLWPSFLARRHATRGARLTLCVMKGAPAIGDRPPANVLVSSGDCEKRAAYNYGIVFRAFYRGETHFAPPTRLANGGLRPPAPATISGRADAASSASSAGRFVVAASRCLSAASWHDGIGPAVAPAFRE